MTSGQKTSNFTSYVTGEALNSSDEAMQEDFEPKLLNGELEAARAKNVSLYVAQKKKSSKGQIISDERLGVLIITNFRLSFTMFGNVDNADVAYQENNYLGKYDISLSNIDKIYQITDKKKRPVLPDNRNSSKVEAIRIICKNFRLLTFDFAASDVGKGKHIADALLKFAFPSQHNVLFLYRFKVEYYNVVRSVRMFNQESDWEQELKRCNSDANWRVLELDKIEDTMPRFYVVPKHLTNHDYLKVSTSFQRHRAAIWVWGNEQASLVRMASLLDTITDATVENSMLEHVRKCSPHKRQPYLIELDKVLPSIQDVYHSYTKLRELCAPESDRIFMVQESRFYTLLEKTCWLMYVSLCLQYSTELSKRLSDGETVVLQETEGRDMCCVISSLIQLLSDPYFRTITGFQTLIQKEWVSLGHPFSDRMGHVSKKNTADQGPLFLLFLDCTWQLLEQFPDLFEFSETFLTTIWDSVFLPIFDTFQFNCEYQREKAFQTEKIVLRPVWDWGEQFSDKDIALFSNPLYRRSIAVDGSELPENNRKSRIPAGALLMPGAEDLRKQFGEFVSTRNNQQSSRLSKNIQSMSINPEIQQIPDRLVPRYHIRDLEIWRQCYFRWIPMLEIKNGGFPQIDLFNRVMLNNIQRFRRYLQEHLSGYAFNRISTNSTTIEQHSPSNQMETDDKSASGVQIKINSFFPFTNYTGNSADLNDILTNNGVMLSDGSLYDTSSLAHQYID